MSETTLKKLIKIFAFAALFTPLIALPWFSVFPFIVPKAVFFRSTMVFASVLSILLFFYERKTVDANHSKAKRWHTPLFIAILLFAASMLISTFFGVDMHASIWGNQERMLGLFTIAHYFFLFFVFRYIFDDEKDWKWIFCTLVGVGIVATLVGAFQRYIDPDFLFNRGAGRVVSTLGNPIYFSGLALFTFFASAFFFIKEKDWTKWLFAAGIVSGLFGMYLGNSRGTFVGLAAGLGVALAIYALCSKQQKTVRKAAIGLLIAFILFGIGVFVLRNNNTVRSLPVIGPLASISFDEGTARTRYLAWEIAIKAWKDRPIFGWGPNNYYYAFNQYYNPESLRFGHQETWFDNAHNILLNTLASQGVVGVVGYVGLFVTALWMLCAVYRKDERHIHIFAIFSGFLVAHFVHNLFVFDNLTSYLYFFVTLAFVDVLYRKRIQVAREESVSHAAIFITPLSTTVAVAVAVIAVFFTNVNVMAANNHGYHARGLLIVLGKTELAIDRLERAKQWNSPHTVDIQWDFAVDTLEVLPKVFFKSEIKARELYDIAVKNMQEFIAIHPLDVRARLVYSDLLRGGMVLFGLDLKEEIEGHLKRAEELSPDRQEVEYARITYLAGTGQIDLAIKKSRELIAHDPKIVGPYMSLAKIYYFDKQYSNIPAVLDEAIRADALFTASEDQLFAAQGYEREGRFFDALYWYDQAYQTSGREDIANKRDELSKQTQKEVPKSLDEFFPFETNKSSQEEECDDKTGVCFVAE